MTESTHTPGTWEYSNGKVYGEIIEIASLCQPVVQEEEAMVEANGRLIAAAPLLFDALQGMVNQVNYMLELNDGEIVGYSDTSSFSAMAHARRAIVEATGGAE